MALFEQKQFTSHAGKELSWKIECDALTEEDVETLARLVGKHITFSKVYGVPRGGLRFAEALKKYISPKGPTLIVDDVLTTGTSMEEARKNIGGHSVGVVIFARGECPKWVHAVFSASDWV